MARTQAQRESRSDCKKKNCMDGKGCIICGTEIRILLEHSHWIPKYVFKAVRYFQGDSKLQAIWIKCGYNTVPMCSNHHKLYEKKQLSDKDYSKIKREVDKRFKELKKLTKDPRYSSIIPALKKFMGRDYGI